MPQQSKPGFVTLTYNGHSISYQDDGWFNATEAAVPFGKRPGDWLKLPSLTTTSARCAAILEGRKSPF